MKRKNEGEKPIRHHEFNYLGPIGPTCASKWESFGTGDEEKRVCGGLQQLNNKVVTKEGKNETKKCVVYSVGSNNQYGFEEAVFKRTQCFVEIFDCTINGTFTPPAYIRSRIRTHNVCLGSKTEVVKGRQFMNWTSLNALTGLNTNPDFLKMDIEGYEYSVLHSIIDSGEHFPLQIAMELHLNRNLYPAQLIAFMNYLRVFGGYYLVNRRDNELCGHCSEVMVTMLDCDHHHQGSSKKMALYKNPMNELKEFMKYNALFEDSVKKYLRKRDREIK